MTVKMEIELNVNDENSAVVKHIVSKIEQYMRELKELDSFYSRCEIEED